MNRGIPLSIIRAECLAQIEHLCVRLMPQGKRFGQWWKIRVPWRDDRDASLMVSFSSGRWQDWGTPGDSGTMLDLVMRLDNCTLMEAGDTLAGLMGLSGDVEYKPVKQVVKRCKDCRHVWRRYPKEYGRYRYFCTRLVDFMHGDPVPLWLARNVRGECGKFGRWHEAVEPQGPMDGAVTP